MGKAESLHHKRITRYPEVERRQADLWVLIQPRSERPRVPTASCAEYSMRVLSAPTSSAPQWKSDTGQSAKHDTGLAEMYNGALVELPAITAKALVP